MFLSVFSISVCFIVLGLVISIFFGYMSKSFYYLLGLIAVVFISAGVVNYQFFACICKFILASIFYTLGFYMIYLSIFNSSIFVEATSAISYKVIHLIILFILFLFYLLILFLSFQYIIIF